MRSNRFTERAQEAIRLSQEAASELGHAYVGSEHLLVGLLREQEGAAAQTMKRAGITEEALLARVVETVGRGEPGNIPPQGLTPRTKRIIEIAMAEAGRMGHGYVGTEHLLMGLLHESDCVGTRLLLASGADIARMYYGLQRDTGTGGTPDLPGTSMKERRGTPKVLAQYGRDLTALAAEGALDPVIGRSREVERILQILSRRTKNNPVLIGEPGVGKTAAAEGLAQRIAGGDVPENLRDKRIIALDLSAMLAGTKYRGEFEERIKSAMEEIKRLGDIILFIDELHTLIGAGAAEGAIDAANIFKPALSRGDIQVIGATTLEEYRRHVEKDAALERRFMPVTLGEPTESETVEILRGLRDRYEAHHKVVITDEAIAAAAKLSQRYITDRFLPDKAIDLIDEASSRLRLRALTAPPDLREIEERLERLAAEKESAVTAQDYHKAAELRTQELRLEAELESQKEAWSQLAGGDDKRVSAEEVAAVVAGWTGIPVQRLTEDEASRLLRLEEILHKRVVGQAEAVGAVCRAIRRGRVGLKDPERPTGSFLFLGPTGVGKTELARALAEALFGDRDALIRVDMSEYMEKHATSKLIGSPPGYVGYEEGGQLTEKIRRRPYCVLLFDEIEKAHPDVFNLLLQVLEDGHLTDAHGRKISFKNTVVIMTSNLGARAITEQQKLGFAAGERNDADIKGEVLSELKKAFRPELLNRIDETIVFHRLRAEEIRAIAAHMAGEIIRRIEGLGVTLTLEEDALDYLADKGFDPLYGARPLRRVIRREIEDTVAERLLDGRLAKGSKVAIQAGDGGLEIAVQGD
jgi:ATP-dependent Clp protease ATP-binding subunit ClpC